MSDRKQEIERKKARLEQLKAEREARRKEKEELESSIDRKLENVGIASVQSVVDILAHNDTTSNCEQEEDNKIEEKKM